MEAWHQRLASQRQDLLDDEEEDDLFLGIMIKSLRDVNKGTKARSSSLLRPGKRGTLIEIVQWGMRGF
jgi:hypothetical protein